MVLREDLWVATRLDVISGCAARGSWKPVPDSKMSSSHNGRVLPFSIVWTRGKERSSLPQPSPENYVSDEDLMRRLQSHDAAALDDLFKRHSRLVFGIAVRILRNRSESEDIVQDVFFYLFQKPGLFDPTKGTAKGWIVQIAFSRALDRREHLSRRAFYSGTNVDFLGDTLLASTDTEEEIEARLYRAHLQKAFEELPAVQRRTLEMFYFEGLELREISERLGESLGNVRHHFYRGLERLRKTSFAQSLRAAQGR
jgi:RNA polymerase sigma-70 factor, ECF subfamily